MQISCSSQERLSTHKSTPWRTLPQLRSSRPSHTCTLRKIPFLAVPRPAVTQQDSHWTTSALDLRWRWAGANDKTVHEVHRLRWSGNSRSTEQHRSASVKNRRQGDASQSILQFAAAKARWRSLLLRNDMSTAGKSEGC